MKHLYQNNSISFRKMEDNLRDYKQLAKWLSDPAILKFYDGRDNPFDLEKVKEKYAHRTRGESDVTPCIIEFENQAIGYIQYYKVDPEEYQIQDKIDLERYSNPYGMDLFIGETNYWNKGIGTHIVKGMIDYLIMNEKAGVVFIDPQVNNIRAIKCYERCGFTRITVVEKRELHEGEYRDSLIMFTTSRNNNT